MDLTLLSSQAVSSGWSEKEFKHFLQGTDGIRRETHSANAKTFTGLSPQEIFLQQDFITEEFFELYAHAHARRTDRQPHQPRWRANRFL